MTVTASDSGEGAVSELSCLTTVDGGRCLRKGKWGCGISCWMLDKVVTGKGVIEGSGVLGRGRMAVVDSGCIPSANCRPLQRLLLTVIVFHLSPPFFSHDSTNSGSFCGADSLYGEAGPAQSPITPLRIINRRRVPTPQPTNTSRSAMNAMRKPKK